ncbi:MAG: hypothetical protein ABIH49_03655 [archaeon]
MTNIDFQTWSKIDLRVAKILKVEDVENADKLYKISLDVGKEIGKRVVCAGLKPYYSKDELKGKKVILFVNLEPRMLKGIESQGMLLAADNSESGKVALLTPKVNVNNGSVIEFKND